MTIAYFGVAAMDFRLSGQAFPEGLPYRLWYERVKSDLTNVPGVSDVCLKDDPRSDSHPERWEPHSDESRRDALGQWGFPDESTDLSFMIEIPKAEQSKLSAILNHTASMVQSEKFEVSISSSEGAPVAVVLPADVETSPFAGPMAVEIIFLYLDRELREARSPVFVHLVQPLRPAFAIRTGQTSPEVNDTASGLLVEVEIESPFDLGDLRMHIDGPCAALFMLRTERTHLERLMVTIGDKLDELGDTKLSSWKLAKRSRKIRATRHDIAKWERLLMLVMGSLPAALATLRYDASLPRVLDLADIELGAIEALDVRPMKTELEAYRDTYLRHRDYVRTFVTITFGVFIGKLAEWLDPIFLAIVERLSKPSP